MLKEISVVFFAYEFEVTYFCGCSSLFAKALVERRGMVFNAKEELFLQVEKAFEAK